MDSIDFDRFFEQLAYVIQRKEQGIWRTVSREIRGKSAAFVAWRQRREEDPNVQFRVLSKAESDRYAEGLRASGWVDQRRERPRRRLPLLALPDNL